MNDTPLHRAETAEEAERLIDGGCRVDRPGWMGATPLFRAAERGLTEVARALIRRGANVNAGRPDRPTALHYAANAEVAGVLTDAGAEVEALDGIGRSPLHWAAQFGRPDVAELLIRSGSEVNRPAADGMTPLHWAAQEGRAEVVRLLLREGAEADRQDGRGRTPLHRAAWRGQAEVVEVLLDAGADAGIRNKGGQTPRHEAESNGHEATAKRLEAAQGKSVRAEKVLTEPPARRSLALTKVRTHPLRPEAVTVADQAALHRWGLGEPPGVVTGLQAHHPWFTDMAVDPQGDVFAVTTPGQAIELRRWDDLRVVAQVACPTEGRSGWQALDFSPDGRWLAVAGSYELVRLIDRATGEVVATEEAGEGTCCVRFDPSSRLLATACSFQGGGHVRIDRIEGGRLVPVAELDRSDHRTPGKRFVDTLAHLAFSPDGGSLALFETSAIYPDARPMGWRGDVVVYEAGTWAQRWAASVDAEATGDGRNLAQAGHELGFLTEVLFVDDETLACGATGGHVLFYRVADGKLLRRVRVHPEAPVVSLALEPSGRAVWAALGVGGGTLARVPL
ncbi:ankyrin repeat domain-containing protein [Tautonia plasticadhaerens]|uniref:Phosphocholine transferase AnkX n=1 Tax=Tautonia plasticadhaerens TaxID=2527974 RepID=A0A518H7Q1_9BACT|nr:ankyrin repeat domain-containing protein [Tautonia plasticadhaerens]QDV36898.1 Phosphocholine transferase AnkX [Tautonia plasticadhaerens]